MALIPLAAPLPAQADGDALRQLLNLGAAAVREDLRRREDAQRGAQQSTQRTAQPPSAGGQAQRATAARAAENAAARDLQSDLNALGFDAGPVDGRPGPRTRRAVEAFQASRGFAATGTLDAAQRLVLDGDAARASGQGAQAARLAMHEAQSYLRGLGYDTGAPDGVWGPRSQRALAAWRRDAGRAATGLPPGPDDLAALYASVHGVAPVSMRDAAAGPGDAAPVRIAPSFDCARAGTGTERAICASDRLAALDAELGRAWQARTGTAVARAAELSRQRAWLGQRDACGADAACLEARLSARVLELGGDAGAALARADAATRAALPGDVAGSPPGAMPGGLPGATTIEGPGGRVERDIFAGLAAPDAPAARQVEAASPGERLHLEGNATLRVPQELRRRITLLAIDRDPSLLDDPDAVRDLLFAGAERTARRAFSDLNALERESRIAAAREELLAAAEAVIEPAPGTPIPVTIHLPARPGAFVEGEGFRIPGATRVAASISAEIVSAPRLRIVADLPGDAVLPMDRAEASALLDRIAAARGEGQGLRRVVRGRITSYGRDAALEDFARQGTGREVPATFVVDEVAIYLVRIDRDQAVDDLVAGSEPLWTWTPGGAGTDAAGQDAPTGRADALELARSLGMTIEAGHVVANGGGDWGTFNALALLGREPGLAREDGGFERVAEALLPDDRRRAFFGEDHYAREPSASVLLRGFGLGHQRFGDEFARRDAERTFLDVDLPGIEARIPAWPLAVRQSLDVYLGEYDFERERFELSYSGHGGTDMAVRVVALPLVDRLHGEWEGLISADRFGRLPEHLDLPPEKARVLREAAAGNVIHLGWWAELDWSRNGERIERRFAGRGSSQLPRTGRARLTRAGFFADPGLTAPVLELDPEALLLAPPAEPEPAAAAAAAAAVPATPVIPPETLALAETPLSGMEELMGHAARMLGSEEAADRLARAHPDAAGANEFDVAGVVSRVRRAMAAGAEAPLRLSGDIDLGTYDLEAGTFDLDDAGSASFQMRMAGGTITVEIVGANPFAPLPVAEAAAREIAMERYRTAEYYVELVPETATTGRGWPDRADVTVLARPRQIVFFRNEGGGIETAQVLGRRSLAEENAADRARLDRRFEAAAFEGLAEAVLPVDVHVMDLLAIAHGAEPADPALDAMMAAAFLGQEGAGPVFFGDGEPMPDAARRVLYRPSFRSWIEAKAAALGPDFTVRVHRRVGAPCSEVGVLSQMPGGRAGTALAGELRAVNDQLAEARGRSQGPARVDERAVQLLARPAGDGGQCEHWVGVLRLRDAVVEPWDAHNQTDAVDIAFTATGARALANEGGSMDVIVEGEATATRPVRGGRPGEPLEPGPSHEAVAAARATTEAEASARQATQQADAEAKLRAQVEAEARRLAQAQRTEADAAARAGAEWLDASGLDVTPSERDVVGLRTGQDMAEAHEIAVALPGVVAAFERRRPAEDDKTGLLAYQRLYLRRDGTETVMLAGPSPEGPVLAVARRLADDERALPLDAIAASVEDKYGAPDGDLIGELSMSVWADAEPEDCIAMAEEALNADAMVEVDAASPSQGRRLRDVLAQPWATEPPALAPGAVTGAARCGEVLLFSLERPLDWGHSGFALTLIDMAALATLEAAGAGSAAEVEIDF